MGVDDTKRLHSVSVSVEVGTYACINENDSHGLSSTSTAATHHFLCSSELSSFWIAKPLCNSHVVRAPSISLPQVMWKLINFM